MTKRVFNVRETVLTPKTDKRATEDVPFIYLEQIEDLHTELIVKIAIAGVGHVVDKYESVSLSLYTGEKLTRFSN